MKIYLSGKISGIESTAGRLFEEAEREVIELGHEPVNPMKIPPQGEPTWANHMRADVKALCDCDGIYMLKNWESSKGAKLEFEIASRLDMVIIRQSVVID